MPGPAAFFFASLLAAPGWAAFKKAPPVPALPRTAIPAALPPASAAFPTAASEVLGQLAAWVGQELGMPSLEGQIEAWEKGAAQALREEPGLPLARALAAGLSAVPGLAPQVEAHVENLLTGSLRALPVGGGKTKFQVLDRGLYAVCPSQGVYRRNPEGWTRITDVEGIKNVAEYGAALYVVVEDEAHKTSVWRLESGQWLKEDMPEPRGHLIELQAHGPELYARAHGYLHVKKDGVWRTILESEHATASLAVRHGVPHVEVDEKGLLRLEQGRWEPVRPGVLDEALSVVELNGRTFALMKDRRDGGVYELKNGAWVLSLAHVATHLEAAEGRLYAVTWHGALYTYDGQRWGPLSNPVGKVSSFAVHKHNLYLTTASGTRVLSLPPPGLPADWRDRVVDDVAEKIAAPAPARALGLWRALGISLGPRLGFEPLTGREAAWKSKTSAWLRDHPESSAAKGLASGLAAAYGLDAHAQEQAEAMISGDPIPADLDHASKLFQVHREVYAAVSAGHPNHGLYRWDGKDWSKHSGLSTIQEVFEYQGRLHAIAYHNYECHLFSWEDGEWREDPALDPSVHIGQAAVDGAKLYAVSFREIRIKAGGAWTRIYRHEKDDGKGIRHFELVGGTPYLVDGSRGVLKMDGQGRWLEAPEDDPQKARIREAAHFHRSFFPLHEVASSGAERFTLELGGIVRRPLRAPELPVDWKERLIMDAAGAMAAPESPRPQAPSRRLFGGLSKTLGGDRSKISALEATAAPADVWAELERSLMSEAGTSGPSRVKEWKARVEALLRERPEEDLAAALLRTFIETHGLAGRPEAAVLEAAAENVALPKHGLSEREDVQGLFEAEGRLYASSISGLYRYEAGAWEQLMSGSVLDLAHLQGALHAAAADGVYRRGEDGFWAKIHDVPSFKLGLAGGRPAVVDREGVSELGSEKAEPLFWHPHEHARHLTAAGDVLYVSDEDALYEGRREPVVQREGAFSKAARFFHLTRDTGRVKWRKIFADKVDERDYERHFGPSIRQVPGQVYASAVVQGTLYAAAQSGLHALRDGRFRKELDGPATAVFELGSLTCAVANGNLYVLEEGGWAKRRSDLHFGVHAAAGRILYVRPSSDPTRVKPALILSGREQSELLAGLGRPSPPRPPAPGPGRPKRTLFSAAARLLGAAKSRLPQMGDARGPWDVVAAWVGKCLRVRVARGEAWKRETAKILRNAPEIGFPEALARGLASAQDVEPEDLGRVESLMAGQPVLDRPRVSAEFIEAGGSLYAASFQGIDELKDGVWERRFSEPLGLIAVQKKYGSAVYIGTSRGLFKLSRGTLVKELPDPIEALSQLDGRLYAFNEFKAFMLTPKGWELAARSPKRVRGAARHKGELYLATTHGVFRAGRLQNTWEEFLSGKRVVSIATYLGGLFAATPEQVFELSRDHKLPTLAKAEFPTLARKESGEILQLEALDGRLFAVAAGGLYERRLLAWEKVLDAKFGHSVTERRVVALNGRIYAAAKDGVYCELSKGEWRKAAGSASDLMVRNGKVFAFSYDSDAATYVGEGLEWRKIAFGRLQDAAIRSGKIYLTSSRASKTKGIYVLHEPDPAMPANWRDRLLENLAERVADREDPEAERRGRGRTIFRKK